MVKLDTQENPFWLVGILLIQKMTAQGVKEVNVMPKSNKITGGGQQMSMWLSKHFRRLELSKAGTGGREEGELPATGHI